MLMAADRADGRADDGRIVVDPDVLLGKPVAKGTRIAVELVLGHLAEKPDVTHLLAA